MAEEAEVFVGTIGSYTARLIWTKMVGKRGMFLPFYSIDGFTLCCSMAYSWISKDRCGDLNILNKKSEPGVRKCIKDWVKQWSRPFVMENAPFKVYPSLHI